MATPPMKNARSNLVVLPMNTATRLKRKVRTYELVHDTDLNGFWYGNGQTLGGIPFVDTIRCSVYVAVASTGANWPGTFFRADRAMRLVAVSERHAVAGNDASAVTVMLKKVPSATAPGSGTDMLSAGISLKGTANTAAAGSLHATAANLVLAAGDSLAVVSTGVLTTLAGVCVDVTLIPL